MEKKKAKKVREEEVLREWPPLGKYRIRLLANSRNPAGDPVLDIREYVSADSFEGFTRRGIRIADRGHLDVLRDVLKELLEQTGFVKPSPGMLPVSS